MLERILKVMLELLMSMLRVVLEMLERMLRVVSERHRAVCIKDIRRAPKETSYYS